MGFKDPHLKKNAHKNKQQSENITIDAKHNEMIKYFQNLQKSIPDKKKELKSLQDQFTTMNNVEHNDFDMEFILFKDSVEEKIHHLEKELLDIIDKKEEKNYYLNVGTLLIDYYDNLEHSKIKQHHIQSADEFLISHDNQSIDDDEFDDDFDDEDEDIDEEDIIEETKTITKKKNTPSKPTRNILDFFQGTIEEEEIQEEQISISQATANARLISQAPAMLEALKSLVSGFDCDTPECFKVTRLESIVEKARAIMRAAEVGE
jgi:hypothetical protein